MHRPLSGPASATVGIAYAWDQTLGGDNIYVYSDLETGIPNTGIALGHLGYTTGFSLRRCFRDCRATIPFDY